MARIQILQLPSSGNGEQPFALIVDQCETPPRRLVTGASTDPPPPPSGTPRPYEAALALRLHRDDWLEFGKQIGAAGVLVTPERVEIVDSPAGEDAPLVEFDHAALADSFATALRFHLESGEASDALRAWCERRAATATDGR